MAHVDRTALHQTCLVFRALSLGTPSAQVRTHSPLYLRRDGIRLLGQLLRIDFWMEGQSTPVFLVRYCEPVMYSRYICALLSRTECPYK